MKFQWEPSRNGKEGHETLYVENDQGRRFVMAQIYPSQSNNPEMGYTMVNRDMNYGLDGKFIPQNNKAWNLTLDAAKSKAQFAVQQHIDNAHDLTTGRGLSPERQGGIPEQHAPDQEAELER